MTKQIQKYFTFLVLFIVFVFVESSIADMYKWVDQNGVTHISDTPPHTADNSKIETFPTENRDNRSNTADSVRQNPLVKEPKVELYTTSWCPWCKKAKAFFRSRGITFDEYDIEKDKKAANRKEQLDSKKGVPFAVINGKGVHGYSEEAYNEALSH